MKGNEDNERRFLSSQTNLSLPFQQESAGNVNKALLLRGISSTVKIRDSQKQKGHVIITACLLSDQKSLDDYTIRVIEISRERITVSILPVDDRFFQSEIFQRPFRIFSCSISLSLFSQFPCTIERRYCGNLPRRQGKSIVPKQYWSFGEKGSNDAWKST